MQQDGNQPGNVVSPGGNSNENNWQFHAEEASNNAATAQTSADPNGSITWTASEFIAHNKTGGWYGLLALGTFGLAAVVYLATRGDKVSTGMVIIVAIVFASFGARKPREIAYGVDNQGITIGQKAFPYSSFRSFSIVQEDAVESIWFMPLKRFMPIITIYFDPKDGEKIVDTLSRSLPLEEHKMDPVDRLMQRMRF